MNWKMLGNRIKKLREKNRLTQEEVERALGLSAKALTHIEGGSRKVSTLELAEFAKLFRVPIADFFSEEPWEEELLITLYRVAPGLESDPIIQRQVEKCVQICEEGAFLKELLALSCQGTLRSYTCTPPKDVNEAKKQGDEVAKKERHSLEIGYAPIRDIAEILSSQGIWTLQTALPSEMSGLFLHHNSVGMAIIVNSRHAPVRQRFSYAHEYAHALFDAKRMVSISTADRKSDLVEIRANAFASAFLLPEEGISRLLRSMGKGERSRIDSAIYDGATGSVVYGHARKTAHSQKILPQTVSWIAHYFGASYQATVYRLQNLGYIRAKEKDFLLREESTGREYLRILRLKQEKEISSENRELKAQIALLITEAYSIEKISRGRLLELSKVLEISGEELLKYAESGKEL